MIKDCLQIVKPDQNILQKIETSDIQTLQAYYYEKKTKPYIIDSKVIGIYPK